jgi:hypothetical protein
MSCKRNGLMIGLFMVTCRLRSRLGAIISGCSYFCLHFTRQLGPRPTLSTSAGVHMEAKQPPHGFLALNNPFRVD